MNPLIFSLLNFIALVFLLHRLLKKPVVTFFEKNATEIEEKIHHAKKLMNEAEKHYHETEHRFAQLETELESIRNMTRSLTEQETRALRERSQHQAERLLADAKRQIHQEEERSFETVRRHVLEKAFDATLQELKEGLSEERQRSVVNASIASLEKLTGFGMRHLQKEERV